jgi:hypothetical protein
MDIFDSGIPNLRIGTAGTKRNLIQFIETTTVLEAWNGYMQNYRNEKKITDGTVSLDFGGYNAAVHKSLDWQPQINAYHHLLENQYEIRDSIIRTLIEKFEWLKETYDWDSGDEPDVPRIPPPADFDFKPFIGPMSVNFVEEESKNNIAYLQWHFDCAWDPEHGLAVITHEARVIDLDRGETDIWKIYEDNGTLAEKQKEYDEWAKNFKPPKRQKPWWEFW